MGDALQRGWFVSCDPDEPAHRITMAIAYGEAKEDCPDTAIPYYAALWDKLAPGIRAALESGAVIDCEGDPALTPEE